MPCPHSLVCDPSSCSQCLGAAARKVWRDEDSGVLMIDGVEQDRPFVAPPDEHLTAHYRRGAKNSHSRTRRKL